MGLIPQEYPQDAVYWEFNSHLADGSITVKAAKKLTMFFPEGAGTLEIGPEGEPVSDPVQAFVDRELSLRTIIRLGPFCEIPDPADALFIVTSTNSAPDLRAGEFALSVTLKRYGERLPTIV